jgi:hypothetical protein
LIKILLENSYFSPAQAHTPHAKRGANLGIILEKYYLSIRQFSNA